MQQLANIMSLPLADYDFQSVAQRDEPALAAEGAHLADMVHVDDSVAMDSLKLAGR